MAVFTAGDGARIAFSDQGTGLPVPVLAGLTRSMSDFDYVAPHLTGVRPDPHGLPRPRRVRMDRGAETYTVPREARDAIDLPGSFGDRPCRGAGHVARRAGRHVVLAATAHDRLSGLCLNDVGPEIARAGLERIFDYVGRNPRLPAIPNWRRACPG